MPGSCCSWNATGTTTPSQHTADRLTIRRPWSNASFRSSPTAKWSCFGRLTMPDLRETGPVTEEIQMAKKHTGQCACGSIKFEFDTDPTFVAVCHCLDCKRASGGEA